LPILQVNSHSIDQKNGEICTGQADLQPISFKSDRLLVDISDMSALIKRRHVAALHIGESMNSKSDKQPDPLRPAEELLHELQVHQIELEMQNDELRRTQFELQESRDRYRDLYDFAPIGYLTLTCEALISEINLTGANLLGEECSKLIQHRFAALVAAEERDYWHQHFTHTLQHDGKHSCELQLQRSDGSRFYVQLDSLRLTNGRTTTMVRISFTDISKHRETEAREARLRNILDSTLDMIFIFAPDTLRFVYMNKGAIEYSGYSQEKLLQMSAPDVMLQLPELACSTSIAMLISGEKEMLRCETLLRCSDGSDFPVEVQIQLVQEGEDDRGLFVAIMRDISARTIIEQEFWQQKNLMWQVIDMDPNLIFVMDMAGNFLLANQPTADFFGMTVQDLVGKNNRDVNPGKNVAEGFLSTDQDVIESRREVTSTESVRMPDGKLRWFLTTKRPLLLADDSVNVLCIAADISELKQSEIKLAESYAKLQRLSLYLENARADERAKIALNLHDEMGATLAAMKMRVAWLASKMPPDMPHLAAETAQIAELVSGGIRIVRQVVTQLRPNLLDDIGLVAALRDYVKIFEQHTKIECSLDLPEQEFTLGRDQSATVFRIVQESLNNVAKHAQASRADIIMALRDGALHLTVKDDGIGFDPALPKEHSFGLLGIKERALMIDGEATIDSMPGAGTRVSVKIPEVDHE